MDTFDFITGTVLPPLLEGTFITLKIIVLSIPFSILIGIITALGRLYGGRGVSFLCSAYVIFFRGIPLIVTLFIVYYGFPSIGIFVSPITASVLVFSLVSGAYQSEYVRGAIQSIKVGQMMAAEAIGMTKLSAIVHIILPQALRRALPGCFNEIIYLVKYSSLAFLVTVVELTGAGKILSSRYFRSTEIFFTVGVIYLVLVTVVTKLLQLIENRLKIPGFGMEMLGSSEHHELH